MGGESANDKARRKKGTGGDAQVIAGGEERKGRKVGGCVPIRVR